MQPGGLRATLLTCSLTRPRSPRAASTPMRAWIASPSRDHEFKTLLARLIEAWADETGTDLEGLGSTTFRKEALERGLDLPDFAIEVVVSSALVDKLAVYRGLGIREVWIFKDETLSVYELAGGAYVAQSTSDLLPTLDLALLASFVRSDAKQSAAVRAYRAELRARTSNA